MVVDLKTMLRVSFFTTDVASSGCRWRRQPEDMEGRCKYIE
jgi:hypothetical protein